MTQLFKIEEHCTTGWILIEERAQKLTKDQCKIMLENYMSEGYNPNYLRVVLDS